MRNESNTTDTTTKVLMYLQLATCIVPIFAHIALAIMAWMQHNWMMLAMIVPSIMMYAASLIPQILQYLNNQEHAQKTQNCQNHTESDDFCYGQKIIKNLPDTLTPVSLESLLMSRATDSKSQPPWKEVLRAWLKNTSANFSQNTTKYSHNSINACTTLPYSKNEHLIAPLGVSYNGYCNIDLVSNGPHALVAGTTGSGKSVLLTTWCLALAFQYSPKQLRFVFMDFKGGATFDVLSTLPHAMGNVGDLNLKHATRALRGLELELDRRERLVAKQGCHNISQVNPPEPSLLIVIDEFHALKNQLPDYMPRLIRIASVGRSLGMHIIAGTQNPLGQVSADMKANISINICLRVRDGLQSQELLGTSHAARISPNMPGSAYYNLGEGVEALRCARSRDSKRLVKAIQLAGAFCHHEHSPELFSSPLPTILPTEKLEQYENTSYENTSYEKQDLDKQKLDQQKLNEKELQIKYVTIGLKDNSIRLLPAILPLHLGNVAVIGGRKKGKSTILYVISKALHVPVYTPKTMQSEGTSILQNSTIPLIIDDADELLDPLNNNKQAIAFQERLNNSRHPAIFSTHTARHLRLPEQAPIRIIFPTGDIGTDAMLGIPSELSKSLDVQDYQIPGRCVIVAPGTANLAQIVLPNK